MISEQHVWHVNPFTVPANTRTFISLHPAINFHDNETISLSPEDRKCYFNVCIIEIDILFHFDSYKKKAFLILKDEINKLSPNTLPGHPYMLENCLAFCHLNYMIKYCNCSINIFFTPGKFIFTI